MELIASAMDKLQITQERNYRGRMSPTRQHSDDDSEVSESENFKAERRRRQNVNHKLCILRCQVPIITKEDVVDIVASNIDADKFWVKIIIEKRRGRFSRWLEAMDFHGFHLSDTNVTTSNGAFLITSWVKNIDGDKLPIHQTRELLLDIISGT